MFCRNCGEPMNDNQEFCLRCGVKKGTGLSFCPNCANPVYPNADVCVRCGISLKKMASGLNGQDKVTMALICFFLGAIGIHNFMMGETKKGVFKIVFCFCFGISAIFALVDLIKILTDSYVVNPDAII